MASNRPATAPSPSPQRSRDVVADLCDVSPSPQKRLVHHPTTQAAAPAPVVQHKVPVVQHEHECSCPKCDVMEARVSELEQEVQTLSLSLEQERARTSYYKNKLARVAGVIVMASEIVKEKANM